MTWSWYFRCRACGGAAPYVAGVRRTSNGTPGDLLICPDCGGTKFDDPRPARRVSTSVWYRPSTWYTRTWEWNDTEARPIPTDDPPPPCGSSTRSPSRETPPQPRRQIKEF